MRRGRASDLDWIERTFHIAPDGGSGITEVAIAALAVITLFAVVSLLVAQRGGGKRA
jgi:hypothetical protein